MTKQILNVYESRHIAQSEFKLACSKLFASDVASYTSLSIEGGGYCTVFGYYDDFNSFLCKYLHGRNWWEINDFANLPYDVWTIAQARIRE